MELFDYNKYKNVKKHGISSYYLNYPIQKNSGGKRWICAPIGELKDIQYDLLNKLLSYGKPHDNAVGFRPGVSVKEGAEKHLNKKVILNIDLKDFFPSIKTDKVIKAITPILSIMNSLELFDYFKLSAYEISELMTYRGKVPQGAPTSPALSNLVAKGLDFDLHDLAIKNNLEYTRYADDMSFSSDDYSMDMMTIYSDVIKICQKHLFTINKKKTRILRPHQRMTVTGIVVNDKLGVPKWKRKNFRAKLHNLIKSNKVISKEEYQKIRGYAEWINQLHPKHGKAFLEDIGKINYTQ